MVVYFLGSRKRNETIEMSNLNSHSHEEQSPSYPHDVHDETNFCDGVNLPQKLLNLQLLHTHTNEGMHKCMVSACSQCYMCIL